jgi:pimeloyl-ACP methyl ester carboxylesterase
MSGGLGSTLLKTARRVAVVALVLVAVAVALPLLASALSLDGYGAVRPPRGRDVTIGEGRRLAVLDQGSGPAVLLVHGLPGDATHLAALANQLRLWGLRTVRYDRLGWGYSSRRPPGESATFERNAGELLLLEEALGVRAAAWIGYSYGGGVVQEAARLEPSRVPPVVLISGVGPSRVRRPPSLAGRVLFSSPVLRWTFSTLPTAEAFAGPAFASLFAPEGPPPASFTGPTMAMLAEPGAIATWGAESRAADYAGLRPESLTGRVLVLHGADDRTVPPEVARDVAARIPGSRLELFEGAGHALPTTRAEAVAERVADSLGHQTGSPS